jgi:hypothetical protein
MAGMSRAPYVRQISRIPVRQPPSHMARWLDLVGGILQWIGRLYGLIILAAGVLLLYWGGRGALAYVTGVRAAWSDPLACAAGLVGGVLGVWAGARVVRRGLPSRAGGPSSELDATLEEAMKLERHDPAAARQLLDGYFTHQAATDEARRENLRARSAYDVDAALALRKELQNELELNALFRKDVLKKWPEDQRGPMLAEIDQTDHQFQSELRVLEDKIARLRLR